MADVALGVCGRDAEIALHGRDGRLLATIEIDRRLRRAVRRRDLTASASMCAGKQLRHVIFERLVGIGRGVAEIFLLRQFAPGILVIDRVRGLDHAPVVDRSGRARRDAIHAEIALLRIDHIVVGVMRDGADRTRRLARIAADADLGIDEVHLAERRLVFGKRGHGRCSAWRFRAARVRLIVIDQCTT